MFPQLGSEIKDTPENGGKTNGDLGNEVPEEGKLHMHMHVHIIRTHTCANIHTHMHTHTHINVHAHTNIHT